MNKSESLVYIISTVKAGQVWFGQTGTDSTIGIGMNFESGGGDLNHEVDL